MEEKRRIILICCFVICWGNLFSQTYTLSDCINYAYTHRTELQKQQTSDTYYRKYHTYSKIGLLPSVSGKANYQFSSDRQNQLTQSATADLSSELVLFNGFQTFNSLKQSKLLKERNKTYTEKIRNDIRLEITEIFYSLLLAQENIKISENAIQSAEQQISLITEAVKAGRTSSIDLLEMQAQLEKERSNCIAAVNQREQNFIKLKKAVNYEDKQTFSIASVPIVPKVPPNAENLFLSAISTLPEFQLTRQDSLFAVYDLKRVKGQYSPYLSLFGSLSSQYQKLPAGENNPFKNQLNDNFTKIAGISLVIPIYSRHEIRKQQIEKERQLSDITLDNKQIYRDVYFEIERLWQEIAQNQENLETIEKRYNYSKQIYEMRQEQYRHGVLSITDLLIAENNMKNAEIELVYQKYNLQYNLALIEFYSGGK